jgi:tetratricopeptide (TPR) repeat protein
MNISRNAPCPCGSGKKYKQCCGKGKPSFAPRVAPSRVPDLQQAFAQAAQLFNAGHLASAAGLCQQILQFHPRHGDTLNLLGLIEFRLGRHEQAMDQLKQAIAAGSDNAFYRNNLGNILQAMQRYEEAEACFERAISLRPEIADFHYNLGNARYKRKDTETASASLRHALALKPDHVQALINLGHCLRSMGQAEESAQQFRRATEIAPQDAEAWHHLGNLLRDQGQLTEAIRHQEQAIAVAPGHENAHISLAITLFEASLLERGWEEYTWRFKERKPDGSPSIETRPFPQPLWQGEPLAGKRLLIWGEQGLGDKLMFANMLPDVIQAADEVFMECDPRLVSLLSRSFPSANFYPMRNPPDLGLRQSGADFQTPLGNLARWFRTSLDDFPRQGGFLVPDADQVMAYRDWLESLGTGLKVGISWRSMLRGGYRDLHYTELDQWGEILKTPGVVFVNLQYGDCAEELADARQRFGVEIHQAPGLDLKDDLDQAASLTSALDMVISAGTSVCAMAGALGKETWMFTIKDVWDRLGAENYPWFPSVRIFERNEPGWEACLAEIACELGWRNSRKGIAPNQAQDPKHEHQP